MTIRTVVTGGAGFVGKALTRRLRAAGETVVSFDLAAPSHTDDIQGSILNAGAVARAVESAGSVFHLAGNAQLWAKDASAFDRVNREGTRIVLEAARAAGARSFVHCSSLTTLVGRETPIGRSDADEGTRLKESDMLGPYPRSKRAAERLVEAAADGFPAAIAIPTEPLGAGDEAMTPPTRMIIDFVNGDTPAYIDCILNFVPVDSLAEGLIAVRDRGRDGERYLLGGENTTMRDLLAMLGDMTGRKMPKTRMPYAVALAAGAVDTKLVSAIAAKPPKAPLTGVRLAGRQVSFSSAKAARELGWRAGPLEPALREMLDWARERGLIR